MIIPTPIKGNERFYEKIHLNFIENSQPTDPSECLITKLNPWCAMGMSTTFTITARNSLQQQQLYGGDTFRVLLKHEESGKQCKGSVNSQNNGTYIVTLKPTEIGLHSINVFLNGVPFIKPETIHVNNGKLLNCFYLTKLQLMIHNWTYLILVWKLIK